MAKLDFTNTDENIVLNSKCFSAYKGKLVIRMGSFRHRSFSFGALFISKVERAGYPESINIVRHEYGHSKQLELLGLMRYIKYIGRPSVRSKVKGLVYYDQPWEVHADVCGGVSRFHEKEIIAAGEAYIAAILPRKKT